MNNQILGLKNSTSRQVFTYHRKAKLKKMEQKPILPGEVAQAWKPSKPTEPNPISKRSH